MAIGEKIRKLGNYIELTQKALDKLSGTKTVEPPKPFTDPLPQYNKDSSIYIDPNIRTMTIQYT